MAKSSRRQRHRLVSSIRPRPRPSAVARVGQRAKQANKALLAAVGAGIITLVSGTIVALPRWVADKVNDPPLPITATGEMEKADIMAENLDCGDTYHVPGQLTGPISVDDGGLRRLLVDRKAAQRGSNIGTFIVQARPDSSPVVLTAIRVDVVSSVATSPGTKIIIRPKPHGACVGPVSEEIGVDINLDAPNPVTRIRTGGDPVDPARFAYTVDNRSPVAVFVHAKVAGHDVEWKLRLDYSVNGKIGSIVLDAGGQPFRLYGTSATEETTQLAYDEARGRWMIVGT